MCVLLSHRYTRLFCFVLRSPLNSTACLKKKKSQEKAEKMTMNSSKRAVSEYRWEISPTGGGGFCYLRIQFWWLNWRKALHFVYSSALRMTRVENPSDALVQNPRDFNKLQTISASVKWASSNHVQSPWFHLVDPNWFGPVIGMSCFEMCRGTLAQSILCLFYCLVLHQLHMTCFE